MMKLIWIVCWEFKKHQFKKFNLTHPQFVVLATLAWLTKDKNKVSQIDIGRMAGLDPNTTSQIIRGLETKKLVKRTQSADQRSKNPIITPFGSEILSQALPAVEKVDGYFFEKLKNNEVLNLVKLFQKLLT